MLTLVSGPSRVQVDTIWPKVPSINHMVSIDYLVRSDAPGKHRLSYQGGHSKGLEVISQELFLDELNPLMHRYNTEDSR